MNATSLMGAKIGIMTQLSINTTQNVNINFTAASVGDRIFAQLLDFLVMIAYAVVVGFIALALILFLITINHI